MSGNNAYNNVITLLEQCAKIHMKIDKLSIKMQSMPFDSDEVDDLEGEINFLSRYCKNLEDQAVVMINENNLSNIPSLESIKQSLFT